MENCRNLRQVLLSNYFAKKTFARRIVYRTCSWEDKMFERFKRGHQRQRAALYLVEPEGSCAL